MALVVVDSDVLIDALRGRQPAVRQVTDGLHAGVLCTTTVTVFELLSGARTDAESAAVDRLLAALTILPFDEIACRAAAGVRRGLTSQGRSIGMADYMIAGICVARSAALLTRNRAHFERVPRLALATE
ncbi:MAG TPA: type II toxin-antitoxin system VapC family toxin [Gemmatimonadales bacterium]|nr:type II toxin-antitoxin system VapC family toxin [Gemmatimonadales bacterium]